MSIELSLPGHHTKETNTRRNPGEPIFSFIIATDVPGRKSNSFLILQLAVGVHAMKVTAPRHLSTEWGIHDSYYTYIRGQIGSLANWRLAYCAFNSPLFDLWHSLMSTARLMSGTEQDLLLIGQ